MIAIIALSAATLILGILLGVSIAYNVKFARIIFKAEDAIETGLDVLDTCYNNMSKIADTEIFFDSPEVQQAVNTIQNSRDAILFVANAIASIDASAILDEEKEES